MKTSPKKADGTVLSGLAQAYGDEVIARKLLESWRWPNGPVCPHCHNTGEKLISLLKRAIIGAWHHISREHLPRYANEFAFRWNTRHDTDGQRLQRVIEWIGGKRLTYRQVSQPLCVC
jgi:hypothetical protein